MKTMQEQNEIRERVLRVVRRLPCGQSTTAAGFAMRTGYDKSDVRRVLVDFVARGLVTTSRYRREPPFFKPVRAECKPGHRCKRPACRLAREAARLSRLADEAVCS